MVEVAPDEFAEPRVCAGARVRAIARRERRRNARANADRAGAQMRREVRGSIERGHVARIGIAVDVRVDERVQQRLRYGATAARI